MTARWPSALAVAALVANCALPKASVDETAGQFVYTVDNVCSVIVPKLCAARQPCCDATNVGYRESLCLAQELEECQAGVNAYYEGRADFRADSVDACVAQTTAYFQSCSTFGIDDYFIDQACLWVPFQGKRGEGGPCSLAFDCAPPADPRTLVSCENEVCVHTHYVGEGSPCNAGVGASQICDKNLYCDADFTTGNPPWGGLCVPGISDGQTCDQSYYCGLGRYCDSILKVCQPLKAPSQPCSSGDECESFVCSAGACTSFVASEPVCENCLPGQMTTAVGVCDPLAQQCGAGKTCTLLSDGTLGCAPSTGGGQLFAPCNDHPDCAGGFDCYLGRCTRPCCPSLEFALCGPLGRCTLELNNGVTDGPFLKECTFKPDCNPWSGGAGCAPPETNCGSSNTGKPGCNAPSGQVTSPTLGKACTYANDCDDSQMCYLANGENLCRWLCKVQDFGAPPSGQVGGSPGQGGCATGETCTRLPESTWLGVCTPAA